MNHPIRRWLPLCGLMSLVLSVSAWAKAPPPVKAVKLTVKERESLQGLEALWGTCENRQLAESQLFRLQQKGSVLDGKVFVAGTCMDAAGKVRFGLIAGNTLAQALPEHRANTWGIYEVEAVAFSDVDDDGRSDIVTIVSAMTGVGPEGAVPFSVADVWFQTEDGRFVADSQAEAVLEKVREPTVKKAIAALKKARVRSK
ncbi:hypothetical protein ACN28S_20865 [Cystobacter fuscus]